MNPYLSVIIPTHNGEKTISTAVMSVVNQTYKDWELIIVLDSCEDETKKTVMNLFDSEPDNVRFVCTEFRRDGLSRNAGIDDARGEWILFLDDDDYFIHEYCFEKLVEKLQTIGSDVLDFSFIWKGKGYMDPTPESQFVMAWCRAWRRSFIGDNRFNDLPYGSDKEFYERMILNNPGCSITFWNFPIYYYNYMREGSLSWNQKQIAKLDIIITHHAEPKDICMRSLDMIAIQQNIDFSDICVTFVNTDCEYAIETSDVCNYPFKVRLMNEFGKTMCEARYYATSNTEAPWIMYCNCDDMFADVCSLSQILSNFPNDDYDILWCSIVQQTAWANGTTYLNCIDSPNFSNTDGKLYRREFLNESNIIYGDDKLWGDYIFGAVTLAAVKPFRIAKVMSDFHLYYKSYRKDSLRHSNEAVNETMTKIILRDTKVLKKMVELHTHGIVGEQQIRLALARLIIRQYLTVYEPAVISNKEIIKELVWSMNLIDIYQKLYHQFNALTSPDIDVIFDEVQAEVMNFIERTYNEHKRELYMANDDTSFSDWIEQLNEKAFSGAMACEEEHDGQDMPAESTQPVQCKPINRHDQNRTVVYCGTKEVYENMVASAKSLLYNTPVDRVVFVVEDDSIDEITGMLPADQPNVISLYPIHNKGQNTFPSDGPNYNNSWTYMCMMRACFPQMFDNEDKILSLDVDTVINADISELWDLNMTRHYLAGVEEPQRRKSTTDPYYLNFGVVMMNLALLREHGKADEIIKLLNTQKLDCPEQTAFNRVCSDGICCIPNDYNHTVYSHITGDSENPKILHYAGQKFWKHYAPVKRYADMSWEEVLQRQSELKGDE